MKTNDNFKLHGAMQATLIRGDGSAQTFRKDNMILDVGFDFIADAIGKSSNRPAVMTHVGIGSGTAAAAPGQTTLTAEIGPRQAALYEHTAGTKTITFTGTFAPGVGTGAITEAAVFNALADGTILDRVVFGVINKGVDDTLIVVFTFTMT